MPLNGERYGNVVPTDVTGTFSYNGRFGTHTYACSGSVKAYSGEGATPLGSILVKPGAGQWTVRVSAFSRIDPDWSSCAGDGNPTSIPNVEIDRDAAPPYGFDAIVRAEDLAALGFVKQNVGATPFPLTCPELEDCTDTEIGEWSGEVLVEAK